MADKTPLVVSTGELEQLQSGDYLSGIDRLGAGSITTPAAIFDGEGTGGTTELRLTRVSADTGSPRIRYRKARGTPGSEAVAASGDLLGVFTFHSHDGTQYQGANTPASCMFYAEVTGTPSGTSPTVSIPAALVFNVTDSGQSANAAAMRVSEENGLFIYVAASNSTPTNLETNAACLFSKDANAQLYAMEEDGTVWFVTGYGVLESDGVLHVPSLTTGGLPTAGTAARVAYNSTTGQLNHDNGTAWVSSPLYRASKTTTYTLVDETFILADTSGGAWTLTLPPAADFVDQPIHIKKTTADGNALTIDANGSETIDDSLTAVITTQYTCLTIVSDGTEWWIL